MKTAQFLHVPSGTEARLQFIRKHNAEPNPEGGFVNPTYRTRAFSALLVAVASLGLNGICRAGGVLVNDTWKDSTRSDPASPTYSENGTDTDSDGDLESAWYFSPGASFGGATPGHLTMTQQAGSSSYTTYFSPAGSEVNLANKGDQLKVTWVFTATGINNASASTSGVRVAVVNNPENTAARLTSDASPPTPTTGGAYTGYAVFGNMRTGNLLAGTDWQVLKRSDTITAPTNLLVNTSSWTNSGFTNSGGANGVPGYTEGAQDTFVMTITHNALDGLDVVATMAGAGLGTGGAGLTVSATDAAPTSFQFDMFALRPSTSADTAATFDTNLFRVETLSVAVPEPASLAVVAVGAAALLARRRRM
jgi:hypothetical protein